MIVYTHPKGAKSSVPATSPHETGGIPGNIAYDFMAPGGTLVLASQDGVISRLSGHDPKTGTWKDGKPNKRGDVFGWSIYLRTADGEYFDTHLGSRVVKVGQKVVAGQKLGTVGKWPNDPGRSHTHRGFTARKGGRKASTARINAVKVARRVKPWTPPV